MQQHENSIITLQPVNTVNNPFSKAHKQSLIIETYQVLQCESLLEKNQLKIAPLLTNQPTLNTVFRAVFIVQISQTIYYNRPKIGLQKELSKPKIVPKLNAGKYLLNCVRGRWIKKSAMWPLEARCSTTRITMIWELQLCSRVS